MSVDMFFSQLMLFTRIDSDSPEYQIRSFSIPFLINVQDPLFRPIGSGLEYGSVRRGCDIEIVCQKDVDDLLLAPYPSLGPTPTHFPKTFDYKTPCRNMASIPHMFNRLHLQVIVGGNLEHIQTLIWTTSWLWHLYTDCISPLSSLNNKVCNYTMNFWRKGSCKVCHESAGYFGSS